MNKKIGFLGCGNIGRAMMRYIQSRDDYDISFIQDLLFERNHAEGIPVIKEQNTDLLEMTDLVVECALADVLKKNAEQILKRCDLMPFSVTAFQDDAFLQFAVALCNQYGTKIYLPHGAILGIDGIVDSRSILREVSIETIKNPASLGRNDAERTVVYDGTTREACALYPRNVNVHATVALAGLGFDKTRSRIISDPSVSTNTHLIDVKGDGIHFVLSISSFSTGGVTGAYTPVSACGSLDRALRGTGVYVYV